MRRLILGVVVMVWLVPGASADNGVLEINAACVSVGCFSGDDPDWPVEIENPGSYLLTSNLTVPDATIDAILVSANDVGIDLNNFSITGPVTCSEGTVLTCSPDVPGGTGVETASSSISGTSVKNGSIVGMGSRGVSLGIQAKVTNLRVRWNRLGGILARYGSTVTDNTAYQNGGIGAIYALDGSTISGNTVYSNGANGISASAGSTVSGNTAYSNYGAGIDVGTGSTISGNTAYQNHGTGISVDTGSTVTGNTARANGFYGLRLFGSESAYSDNVISDNVAGSVGGTGVQLGLNACNGTTCP